MQCPYRKKVRFCGFPGAQLRDLFSHLRIPVVKNALHELFAQGGILRLLLLHFGSQTIQIASEIKIDKFACWREPRGARLFEILERGYQHFHLFLFGERFEYGDLLVETLQAAEFFARFVRDGVEHHIERLPTRTDVRYKLQQLDLRHHRPWFHRRQHRGQNLGGTRRRGCPQALTDSTQETRKDLFTYKRTQVLTWRQHDLAHHGKLRAAVERDLGIENIGCTERPANHFRQLQHAGIGHMHRAVQVAWHRSFYAPQKRFISRAGLSGCTLPAQGDHAYKRDNQKR